MKEILTCEDPNKVLYRNLVATIINFNIVAIEIQMSTSIGVHASRKLVSKVTRRIIREHENNIGIWNAQSFDSSIPRKLPIEN